MFDRFSDSARRVLFVARQEAGEFGGPSIEVEHLLLGLLYDKRGVVARVFDDVHLSADDVRKAIANARPHREKLDAFVELSLSTETVRALEFGIEEAERMQQDVRPEHVLLGMLRTELSLAASILGQYGVRLDAVRTACAASDTSEVHRRVASAGTGRRLVVLRIEFKEEDVAELAAQIEGIKLLLEQMGPTSDSVSNSDIRDRIRDQLDVLKSRLGL